MELKTGYKQTEVGGIPSDWQVFPLNYFLELLTDYDANGSFSDIGGNTNVFDTENFAWYVRATDLENEKDISDVKYVDEKTYKYLKKSKLFGNEVLITKRGEIGKVYFFKMKTAYATLAPNLYLLKLNDKIDAFYLFCFFKSALGQKSLIENNASTTLGALYKDDVKAILVPLPPTLAEQTSIATALSDTDQYITHLEKLIAKKRNIKQGAMQELLKPKEGWVVKKLGEICFPSKQRINPITEKKYYKCVELEHLSQGTGVLLGFAYSNELLSHKSLFEKGDVLFGKLRPYLRKFLFAEFEGVCTTEIWVLKTTQGVFNKFLYHLVQSEKIVEAANLSTGTKMPRAEWKTVSETEIALPAITEQINISSILSDMDTEISSLETKLSKAKSIKQGMMQQLLTGKIRLT